MTRGRSKAKVPKKVSAPPKVMARPVIQYGPNGYRLIKPKTINQQHYVDSIHDYDITLCYGPSGTGKSLVALSTAIEDVMTGNRAKIYVTRPMVATSERDFPYIKGSLYEKLVPYFAPILSNLEDLLGSRKELERLLENKTIEMQAIELMRGFTYKNCYVLITEAQNMTVAQSVMAITRLGENCKMIFEGDTDQKDLRGKSGLTYLIDKLYDTEGLCGVAEMTEKDILRHPLIGKILKKLDYRGEGD
jgi:phosphate starvation-inducible PhoH-like protein